MLCQPFLCTLDTNLIDPFLNNFVAAIVRTINIKFSFRRPEADAYGDAMSKDQLSSVKYMRQSVFKFMGHGRSSCKHFELPNLHVPQIQLIKFLCGNN